PRRPRPLPQLPQRRALPPRRPPRRSRPERRARRQRPRRLAVRLCRAGSTRRRSAEQSAAARFMKIATFNVNGVNGRLPVLLRWLAHAAPDVVCLQELKAPQEKFPEAALRAAGYRAIWHGQKSWNGVAILSRGAQPIETGRGLPGDPEDTHS